MKTSTIDNGDNMALVPKRGKHPPEATAGGSITNRRRIQNRMAQRAYRQRKESTIDALKKRVLALEKSKEDMEREFINLTTLILRQDFVKGCPQIIESIKQSTIGLRCTAQQFDDNEKPDNREVEQVVSASDIADDVLASFTPNAEQIEDFDISMLDYTALPDHTSSLGLATAAQPNSGFNYDSIPCFYNANAYFQS